MHQKICQETRLTPTPRLTDCDCHDQVTYLVNALLFVSCILLSSQSARGLSFAVALSLFLILILILLLLLLLSLPSQLEINLSHHARRCHLPHELGDYRAMGLVGDSITLSC